MDSSDNVINKNPIDFEDEEYDPDLEARLYAEIYYSNETYIPDDESPIDKVTASISQQAVTTRPSTTLSTSNENVIVVNPTLLNTEIQLPSNNFVEDFTPGKNIDDQHFNLEQTYDPKSNWLLGEAIESTYKTIAKSPVGSRSNGKRHRQLAQKGLWLTFKNNTAVGSETGQRNIISLVEDNPTASSPVNPQSVVHSLLTNPENDVIRNDSSCKQTKKNTRRKQRRLKKNVSSQACGKTTSSQYDPLNLTGKTGTANKNNIVAKQRKMRGKKKKPMPLDISSDSDDSILEVPVPPKAPPLIIQLVDSDDDCDRSTNDDSKKNKESNVKRNDKSITSCNNEEESLTNHALSKSLPIETVPLETHEIPKEARNNMGDLPEVSVAFTHPEGDAVIPNCIGFQQGALSLDEIRNIHDAGPLINTHSDDSMTESEANNWGNIAAGQSNTRRDHDVCSVDVSNDTVNTELWNQLVHRNPSSAGVSTDTPILSGNGSSEDQTVANNDKFSNVLTTNKQGAGLRKRQKETASILFADFDVPAIPRKRSKPVEDSPMSEYFFKPMSKELQAHYNNPWGGENLTLYDIQSRMPENPRCWGILDADLYGASSKKRRICGRCNSDSHIGKRCPEKPKTPCCYMCGVMGHTESRCPHTMCLTCGRKYATYRPTCDYCCKLYCNMCNGSGHNNENCPDLWRRYHNTTTETIPIVPADVSNIMKSNQQLSCCNCGRRGHDVTTCRQLRWSQHFPTPTFVSNYTEGPFYESSNREQSQDALTNKDSIYDVPHGERVSYPNYTDDRNCAPPHEERIQETALSNEIEVIELYDDHEASVTVPKSSTPSSNVIFQIGEIAPPKAACLLRATRLLDQVENVHLDGLLNGSLRPTFLFTLRKSFRFSVRITREPEGKSLLIIESKSPVLLNGLEKLMIQWLTRTDNEKSYLEYKSFPYDNRKGMYENLKKKLVLLETALDPDILWKKIVACQDSLKRIREKQGRCVNNAKVRNKLKKNEKREDTILTRRRNELMTSLYSLSWVEGGGAVVESFHEVASRLGSTKKFPARQYLELIYLNNELFTFHTSDVLSRALDKALSASKLSQPIMAPVAKQPVINDTSSSKVPETITKPLANIKVSEMEDPAVHLPNKQVVANDSLPAYPPSKAQEISEQQITVIEESQHIPKMFSEPQAVNAITCINNNDGPCTGQAWEPTNRPVSVNEVRLTQNAEQTKIIKPIIGSKKIRASQGLLIDLPKRQRKLYRRAAREAIKAARLSHVPHLMAMAKALNRKWGNDTMTIGDVDTLRNAIGPDLTRIITNRLSPTTRQSQSAASYRYQSFLKSL